MKPKSFNEWVREIRSPATTEMDLHGIIKANTFPSIKMLKNLPEAGSGRGHKKKERNN